MNLLFGALSMGLVLSLLGLGVYISYRVLDTFDLTVDGSFAFGAVIAGRAADPRDGARSGHRRQDSSRAWWRVRCRG